MGVYSSLRSTVLRDRYGLEWFVMSSEIDPTVGAPAMGARPECQAALVATAPSRTDSGRRAETRVVARCGRAGAAARRVRPGDVDRRAPGKADKCISDDTPPS